jgi:hypothetical protein
MADTRRARTAVKMKPDEQELVPTSDCRTLPRSG